MTRREIKFANHLLSKRDLIQENLEKFYYFVNKDSIFIDWELILNLILDRRFVYKKFDAMISLFKSFDEDTRNGILKLIIDFYQRELAKIDQKLDELKVEHYKLPK